MTERILIIGLDGATWTVLEPYIAAGALPNIARLRDGGVHGELRSTIPPLSAPAWATFMTGKSPARHGVFHFRRQDAGGIVDGRNIDSATLWDVLSHQNRRSIVINMPMTYPPRPVAGVVVTGLLTPPDAPVFTYPPELSERLAGYQIDLDRFIDSKPFAGADETKREVKPDAALIAEFHKMEERRAQTALELMNTEEWDVFAVVFTAPDRMGHYLWQFHLEEDLDEDPDNRALHDAVVEFYTMLDGAIGELVTAAGQTTTTMIVSDHGMGPSYSKLAHWNNWLYQQGYLELAASSRRTVDGWLLRLGLSRDKIRKLAGRVPGLLKSRVASAIRTTPTAALDSDRSAVTYERIFDPVGGFRIHRAGTERNKLRDELMAALADIRDPDSGAPVIAEVLTREECFTGPYASLAPDIVILMKPEYGSSNRLSRYSSIVTDRPIIRDPGSHQMEGVFICSGPDVTATPGPFDGFTIADVAPTVLHNLGLAVPSDMDGRVLQEIFTDSSPSSGPPRKVDPSGRWPSDEEALEYQGAKSADDEGLLEERLRALGYFE